MNFGHKITIVFSLFVVLVITMVYIAVKQKDITLVAEDYYKKEIAYQDEIDKLANTSALQDPIEVNLEGNDVLIQFPKELKGVSGEIHFYRPSNANLDFKVPITLNDSLGQKVSVADLLKGQWIVKLECSNAGKAFLKEKRIIL